MAGTDADKDGVLDRSDACPSEPGGRFDSNKNGCPGPWAQIKPRFIYGTIRTSRGIANISWLAIARLPEGSVVTLRAGSLLSMKLTVGKSGGVRTDRIGKINFEGGATFDVRIVRAGFIGYDGRIEVSTARRPFPVREQCIPAVGRPAPVRCNGVDRGK